MKYTKYILFVILILILIIIKLHYQLTSTENFITSTETITNISSMYNNNTLTTTNLVATSSNFKVDASGLRLGDKFSVDLSGNINGNTNTNNNSFFLNIQIWHNYIPYTLPICDSYGKQFYSNKYTCICISKNAIRLDAARNSASSPYWQIPHKIFVNNGKWWVSTQPMEEHMKDHPDYANVLHLGLLFIPIPFKSYLSPGKELELSSIKNVSPPYKIIDNFPDTTGTYGLGSLINSDYTGYKVLSSDAEFITPNPFPKA